MAIPMGYRKMAADLHARIQAVMLLQAQGVIVGVQGAGLHVAAMPPA